MAVPRGNFPPPLQPYFIVELYYSSVVGRSRKVEVSYLLQEEPRFTVGGGEKEQKETGRRKEKTIWRTRVDCGGRDENELSRQF